MPFPSNTKIKFCLNVIALAVGFGFSSIPASAQTDCVSAPAGLIAWWRAESDVADAVDSHHGTLLNGATFASGQVGQAFRFDGLAAAVDVADSPAWDFITSDFTIEFWLKLNRVKNSMFIYQKNGTVAGGFEFDLQPAINQLVFARDPNHAVVSLTWIPVTNLWYHLAVTRTGNSYLVFVNGQPIAGPTVDSNPIANVNGPIEMGNYTAASYAFDGLLDEMTLYSRALSTNEVLAIFNAGSAGKCGLLSLKIFPTGTNAVVVTWPAPSSPGTVLEQNLNPGGTNWSNTTNAVSLTNGQNQIIVSPLLSNRFYRLHKL